MSGRKDRERAEAGLLFRDGKLVPREEVERPGQARRLAESAHRLRRDHNLTIIGGRLYARRTPVNPESDVQVDLGEEE